MIRGTIGIGGLRYVASLAESYNPYLTGYNSKINADAQSYLDYANVQADFGNDYVMQQRVESGANLRGCRDYIARPGILGGVGAPAAHSGALPLPVPRLDGSRVRHNVPSPRPSSPCRSSHVYDR